MNRIFLCLCGLAATVTPAAGQANGYAIATAAGGANPYYFSGTGDGGQATNAGLGTPAYDVAVDGAGNLYIASGGLIRKVAPDGGISTIAGGGASVGDFVPATQAALSPTALVADSAGDLFIADTAYGSYRIRMVDTKGTITTIAGGAPCCDLGDGGPAANAYLAVPYGLALDKMGNLYVAQVDQQNNLIRKISNGFISTVAGGGSSLGDGGQAAGAQLARPLGVAVDAAGNVYIAEAAGNRIRKVSPAGVITTIGGTGDASSSGDSGPATQAGIAGPRHLAVDAAGNVFVTQTDDARVRMISPGGTITTIAGNGNQGSSGDGGPGPGATLDHPVGIALGNCSQIYVAESSLTVPAVRILNPVPSISPGGVVPAGSSASSIESGSWISIYGSNLAGCTNFWNGDFPASLGGTSVTIDSKPAYLWFVSPSQINVQAPDDPSSGPVSVAVTTAGGTATSTVSLAQYSPAFSLISSKYPAAIVSTSTGFDTIGPAGAFPFPTRPAKAGETLTLFGVGFGPTNPSVAAGKIFSGVANCVTPPQVTIGGIPASVSFAGIVGAGLYQLNVVVPNAGSGDQPLQAIAGGVSTQSNIYITIQ